MVKIKFVVLFIAVIIAAVLVFSVFINPQPRPGGCRFGVTESTNYKITGIDEVVQALNNSNWSLSIGFDKNSIREYNPNSTSEIFPAVLENKNIKYWYISAFKKIGNDTKRVDIIDENGRLYQFFNCI